MTVQRKEMNELTQNLCPCNPHMAKEMTKLTRLIIDHLIKQYSPSL